eukprot:CAMPEP_0194115798 /NCGR_PEP_ID=MMETSP0150-20130528/24667_1 /TAXON_ID=122233 /ORGANISM="Chaetoceros debilis, Strain MM31A-1" /LENGTH=295 /DNA_ID=CAMNT_0038806365 /DNA_START=46 /DNA_END=933 /DNA_ORIENTATION=-
MLFDDLPAAKTDGDDSSSKVDTGKDGGPTPAEPRIVESSDKDKLNEASSLSSSSLSQKQQEQKKKGPSCVHAIGNAGTTMAFMPAALKRRRKASTVQPVRRPKTSSTSNSNSANKTPVAVILPHAQEGNSSVLAHDESSKQNSSDAGIPTSTTTTTTTTMLPLHEQVDEYKESQELVDLHASVRTADIYNPMMPNDYLAYRQRKENEMIRADIEEQAKKTREMQKKLRSQIEEERQRAIKTGNFDKMVGDDEASRMGRGRGAGRGRGRGMSNLPAWLVKKQQEKKQNDGGPSRLN